MNVYENIAVGLDENFSELDLRSRIIDLSKKYGLPLNPDDIVEIFQPDNNKELK